MGACKRTVLAATLAGVVCGAGLAEAQVQAWATRYDSGPITSQDARLAGGDAVRGSGHGNESERDESARREPQDVHGRPSDRILRHRPK